VGGALVDGVLGARAVWVRGTEGHARFSKGDWEDRLGVLVDEFYKIRGVFHDGLITIYYISFLFFPLCGVVVCYPYMDR
jgi:hypothetical protein